MYGMVLMAALTTAPDTSNFGWRSGCTGCTGYVSSCYGSCYGSSCFGSSCYGSSCYGATYSITPAALAGAQAGWNAHGVYYAAPGVIPYAHPVTITPGPGSGGFGDSYLNYSGYGSPVFVNRSGTLVGPTNYGTPIYSSTSFGYGAGFGSGPVYYGPDFHPTYSPVRDSALEPLPPQVRIDRSEYNIAKAKPQAGPARLTIEVPTDAKLYVDGQLTKGEGTTRNFHTPDLSAGQTFYYELKAEVVVGGKTVTEIKTVLVSAGAVISEEFPKLIAAANVSKRDSLVQK